MPPSTPSSPPSAELLRLLTERERRDRRRKLWTYYPDTGPLRRELYPKHMQFFRLGATHHERAAMAGNRTGKTEGLGLYELVLHLTGRYPTWWEGFRFRRAIRAWACGKSSETVRDILQTKLLGPVDERGTGVLPGDDIVRMRARSGIPDMVDSLTVRSQFGGTSKLGFRSYDQGRKAFEGTEQDLILLDEEPPFDIYGECLIRTASTVPGQPGGLIMATFTPLDGLSETALYFLPDLAPPEPVKTT